MSNEEYNNPSNNNMENDNDNKFGRLSQIRYSTIQGNAYGSINTELDKKREYDVSDILTELKKQDKIKTAYFPNTDIIINPDEENPFSSSININTIALNRNTMPNIHFNTNANIDINLNENIEITQSKNVPKLRAKKKVLQKPQAVIEEENKEEEGLKESNDDNAALILKRQLKGKKRQSEIEQLREIERQRDEQRILLQLRIKEEQDKDNKQFEQERDIEIRKQSELVEEKEREVSKQMKIDKEIELEIERNKAIEDEIQKETEYINELEKQKGLMKIKQQSEYDIEAERQKKKQQDEEELDKQIEAKRQLMIQREMEFEMERQRKEEEQKEIEKQRQLDLEKQRELIKIKEEELLMLIKKGKKSDIELERKRAIITQTALDLDQKRERLQKEIESNKQNDEKVNDKQAKGKDLWNSFKWEDKIEPIETKQIQLNPADAFDFPNDNNQQTKIISLNENEEKKEEPNMFAHNQNIFDKMKFDFDMGESVPIKDIDQKKEDNIQLGNKPIEIEINTNSNKEPVKEVIQEIEEKPIKLKSAPKKKKKQKSVKEENKQPELVVKASVIPKTEVIVNEAKKNDPKPKLIKQGKKTEVESIIEIIQNIKQPKFLNDIPVIESFDANEPSLLTEIPQIKETILVNEGSEVINNRRQGLRDHKYLESSLSINTAILEELRNCKEPYDVKMKSNLEKFNMNLSSSSQSPSNSKSSFNSLPKDSLSSTISSIKERTSFFYQYPSCCYTSNDRLMLKYIRNFNHWRQIQCDGNSFYRVFMFSLLENFILENNLTLLNLIANEIILRTVQEPSKTMLKSKGIVNDKAKIVLKEIISLLIKRKQIEAYDVLIKAYQLKDKSFDYTLIAYLRGVLFDYVKEVYDSIGQTIGAENKDCVDKLSHYGIEAEFIHVCIAAYLFNVNIEFFWVDCNDEANKGGDKPNYDVLRIEDRDQEKLPLITFGYVHSHFIKVYPKSLPKNTSDILFNGIDQENNKQITQLTYINTEDDALIECERCNKQSRIVYFLQKNFAVCYECLKDHTDKILTTRAKNYALSHFLSLEYYTKDIPIYGAYYLSEYEYMEIFKNTTIMSSFCNKICQICYCCAKLIENKLENYVLQCECHYCYSCLKAKAEVATKGFHALNRYEKKTFEKVQCECDSNLEIEEVLSLLRDTNEDDYKLARVRLEEYIASMCMCCERKLDIHKGGDKDYDDQDNDETHYKKIIIKQENERIDKDIECDYCNDAHFMCLSCFDKQKDKNTRASFNKEKKESLKRTYVQKVDEFQTQVFEVQIECMFCVKRQIVDVSNWPISNNNNSIKEEKAICNPNCMIY